MTSLPFMDAPPLPDWAHVASIIDYKKTHLLPQILRTLQSNANIFALDPVYCTRRQDVAFHEVLLRLQDDNGKQISPADVFATAAQYGMATEVNLFIIYHQFAFHSQFDAMMSINISPLLLTNRKARTLFWKMLKAYALCGQAGNVILEVLEDQRLPLSANLISFMEKVAALGYKWALDDYGDGHHTEAHIRHLPLSYIKLSGATSEDLAQRDQTPAASAGLEALKACKRLNLPVVAEHISDARQMENLERWYGIHLFQSQTPAFR